MTNVSDINRMAPLGCRLGEGPLWHPEENRLYGVDIEAHTIWCFDPAADVVRMFPTATMVGCLGLRNQGGFVLAYEGGFAFWDPDHQELETLADPEAERPHARFNDGGVDPAGRFWAGTMTPEGFENSLYRLDPDHSVHRMAGGIGISNGIGWSPDHRTLYFTDSPRKCIYAYDYDVLSGSIENRRIWVDSDDVDGVPDGLCVDSEGCVWSARWDGWHVARYDPEGRLMHKHALPVQRPTSCAFGGSDLKTLFITSAWTGLTEVERQSQPHAGDLFITESPVPGQMPNRFMG